MTQGVHVAVLMPQSPRAFGQNEGINLNQPSKWEFNTALKWTNLSERCFDMFCAFFE